MEEENKELSLGMDMFIDTEEDDNFLLEEETNTDLDTEKENNLNENESSEEVVGKESDDDEIDEKDEKEVDDKESSSNPNLFKSLANLLHEKSLISSMDSDVETEDDFVELFKKEIKNSEYSDLSDYQKEYLSKIREGIPQEKIEKDLNDFMQLDSITEEDISKDIDLQKRVLYQDFINRGYSEDKALKYVNRSLELDAGEEDSLDALQSIKESFKKRVEEENERIKNQRLEEEKARESNVKLITKEIENLSEIIPEYPVSENIKSKIKETMFNVVGSNPDTGEPENELMKYRRENPVEFDKKLYYLFTVTKKFENFDLLNKNSRSQAIRDLEKAFSSTTAVKDPGSPSYLQDPNSYDIDLKGDDIHIE